MSLGLFHGLPAWWKKHQAESQRKGIASSAETSDEAALENELMIPSSSPPSPVMSRDALAGSVPDTPTSAHGWDVENAVVQSTL